VQRGIGLLTFDDAMEGASLEMQRLAALPCALLTSAKRSEILCETQEVAMKHGA
jgi:hypothetical protein